MPYSDSRFDTLVEEFIKKNKCGNYFDIGSGAGKYGKLIRNIFPDVNIVGIEAEKSYIKEFKLKDVYNKIHREYIERFIDKYPDFQTEVAIIGDCIEHLKKSVGIDLINFLIYRTKYILIIYPTKVIQYSWRGHHTEAHRSIWSEKDFGGFEYKIRRKDFMNFVVLKGYIGDPKTITVND